MTFDQARKLPIEIYPRKSLIRRDPSNPLDPCERVLARRAVEIKKPPTSCLMDGFLILACFFGSSATCQLVVGSLVFWAGEDSR
jgi:hypothetical protein